MKTELNSNKNFHMEEIFKKKNSIYHSKFWVWLHKMFNLLTWCSLNIYVYKYFIFIIKKFRKKTSKRKTNSFRIYTKEAPHSTTACEMTAVLQGAIKMENYVKTTSLRKPCAPFPAYMSSWLPLSLNSRPLICLNAASEFSYIWSDWKMDIPIS